MKLHEYSSGNKEIDGLREQIELQPTTAENLTIRGFMLKQWACALQHQGMYLEEFVNNDLERMSTFATSSLGREETFLPDDTDKACRLVDEGYAILDKIQKRCAVHGADSIVISPLPALNDSCGKEINWPVYQCNPAHTGYTDSPGPLKGELSWKQPIGLAWYARPAFDGDRMYLSSPGMRTILYCVDIMTGEIIWESKQVSSVITDQLYSCPSNWSSPVVTDDGIVIRQLGSRGTAGLSKYALTLDKESGEIKSKNEVGHIDYRAGWAPIFADDEYLYYARGEQNIEGVPPISAPLNRMVCKHKASDKVVWDIYIGPIFAEPLVVDSDVFTCTSTGMMYCFTKSNGEENFFTKTISGTDTTPNIKWKFKAEAELHSSIAMDNDFLYFGDNLGIFYCLSKASGSLKWRTSLSFNPRAFKQFSKAVLSNGKLFVGSADKKVLCLNALDGTVLWQVELDDWVRSAPALLGNHLYAASLSGMLYKINVDSGELLSNEKISIHPVYSDLCTHNGRLFISSSNLQIRCCDAEMNVLWMRSQIDDFTDNEGYRVLTDQIAGGGYFQSKPTAANGKVFVGTPSRFVFAYDAQSGSEIWKFELGAAISASPVFNNDRIYVGQQGGEDEYYCIDANTGIQFWAQRIGWVWGSCNVSNNMIFIPSVEGFVYSLCADTGSILWRYRTGRSTCTEPLNANGLAIFGGWDNFIYAFEEKTGKLVWQYHLGGISDSGAQIAVGDNLFVPMGGSFYRCLNINTGELIWERDFDKTLLNGSAAYGGGKLYLSTTHGKGVGGVATQSKTICIDASTGEFVWSTHDGGGLCGASVAQDNVYTASTATPYFYCLDANGNTDGTTNIYFRFRMANKMEETCPAIYNRKAYVLSSGFYFYAIE